jgi:dCTP diphosphatase
MKEISEISEALEQFASKRDWNQFHSPKNLAMALAAEVGELLEEFQWLTEEQSKAISSEKLARIKEEIGDVFIYLIRLSSQLNIDLISAANDKILQNEQKYPVQKAKGNAKKYTEF